MSNDMAGGIVIGLGVAALLVGIFQIGLNVGIKLSLRIIENHPDARKILEKNKHEIQILPWVSRL